jgi:hypothetical protein
MATWTDIHINDYGWVGKLALRQDGVAVDISSYTTRQFIFKSPGGTKTTKTATFDTDGTDGVLKYTVEDGLINEAGNWNVQARISKTGVVLTSAPLRFNVANRLDT